MKKVIVASTNPVKINVAKQAFAAVFPGVGFDFIGIQSESGVPEQPMEEETERGAKNRLEYIKRRDPDADFWISQEGGLYSEKGIMFERAYIMVADKAGFVATSSTGSFCIPKQIADYIKEGMELGTAGDTFFNDVNMKQGVGVIGHLTDGLIDRTLYYLQSAIIALSELKHKEWY